MPKGHSRTPGQIEKDRKVRITRKRSDKAYAKTASNHRGRVSAYFVRRNRLTRIQRQVLSFIEGFWTPKGHTAKDEQKRQELRIPTAIIMEANRFQGSKVEGKRQNSIRAFLTGIIRHIHA